MTLRAVIQGLLHGSDDAEAMLADDGYGDLPPEMFGQALSSYADTAPMAEADALSPVLTTMEAGDASDVFAVLEEQPLVISPVADSGALAASVLGVNALDDALDASTEEASTDEIDDFGTSAPDVADDDIEDLDDTTFGADVDEPDEVDTAEDLTEESPFDTDEVFDADDVADTAGDFALEEDFFDTEPVATGEDPSDLDF